MNTKPSTPANSVLNPFIERHQKDVMGVLHCFDRVRLQGSLRVLYCPEAFGKYLGRAKVLYQHFKQFTTKLTAEVCQAAEQLARGLGRPFAYLSRSAISKEEEAQSIVRRDQIEEGLVAVFRCVEPCRTFKMRGNDQTKMLEAFPTATSGCCSLVRARIKLSNDRKLPRYRVAWPCSTPTA
jgi:hypothetical protein